MDDGRSHTPEKVRRAALDAGKSKDTGFPSGAVERVRLCGHFDFSPEKLILDS